MMKICTVGTETSTQLVIQKTLGGKEREIESFKNEAQFLNTHLGDGSRDLVIYDPMNLSTAEISLFVASVKKSHSNALLILLIEPSTSLSATDLLRLNVFRAVLKSNISSELGSVVDAAFSNQEVNDSKSILGDFPTLEELEKRYLKIVLEKTNGRKERAAKILGINRRTLYRKEREYGWVTDEEMAETEN